MSAMRRVLLVDDHQDVLRRYCRLQNKAADVVIADMHLSGTGGPAFLRQIKDSHPDVVRIMVCPEYEISSTYFAVATVHQILAKPVDPYVLLNVVERSCRLRDLLTNSMRKKIGSVGHLPPVPDVYLELTGAIARSETSSAEIAAIIAKDPATTAKLLQLVNSACFGALRQITTLEHAVAYVGTDLIRDLSLSIHLFGALERTALQSAFSFHQEQEHSLLTARVAKRLSAKPAEAQNAFTAALLHDIGKLVLAVCIPGDYKKVQQASNKTLRPRTRSNWRL
jgi:response regulator RpfG family c-di-GMP phosphodiesterase